VSIAAHRYVVPVVVELPRERVADVDDLTW
jgi:hypothetical protein